ncbi:hypothetical protein PPYR_05733, partial [Photinus pyralis]
NENAMLLENMSPVCKGMLQRKLGKKKKYSPELRKFAISLNFFSPKAYNYVRDTFDTCLPHSNTIGKWLQTIDASPGFTTEAFETLRKQVQFSQKPCLCALVIDEMSIRKHLEWDGNKFYGYVNFGVDINDDCNELAKEVFVLLIVAVNGTWKLPIGYFLTNGLSGEQKSSLINQSIIMVQNTGAKIVSLTCDGAPSNISMCSLLGCSLQYPNMQTMFQVGDDKIHFFLDPCHMVKLVRNTFGDKKLMLDQNGNCIQWKYIDELMKLQETEGLHLGNKLRSAHVYFVKQKMKVKLAVQLLSNSVADALEYCDAQLNLDEFKGYR